MDKIYFIIGASCAGKTNTARELEKKRTDIQFFSPDKEQYIPSEEEMVKQYGSSSNWQKAKTIEWVKSIKEKYLNEKAVLMDTQSRYEFIETACAENYINDFQVILFDCENQARNQRIHTRGQPHLANPKMDDWARFLREDAKKHNWIIIDTSNMSVEETVISLENSLK